VSFPSVLPAGNAWDVELKLPTANLPTDKDQQLVARLDQLLTDKSAYNYSDPILFRVHPIGDLQAPTISAVKETLKSGTLQAVAPQAVTKDYLLNTTTFQLEGDAKSLDSTQILLLRSTDPKPIASVAFNLPANAPDRSPWTLSVKDALKADGSYTLRVAQAQGDQVGTPSAPITVV